MLNSRNSDRIKHGPRCVDLSWDLYWNHLTYSGSPLLQLTHLYFTNIDSLSLIELCLILFDNLPYCVCSILFTLFTTIDIIRH